VCEIARAGAKRERRRSDQSSVPAALIDSQRRVPENARQPMSPRAADRAAFRAELLRRQPGWYSPVLHLAFPSLFALGVAIACGLALGNLRPVELLTVPVVLLLSNAAEWRIHRDLLHRRRRLATVLYDRHTPEHHRVFVAGDMAIRELRELRLVLIPFYGIIGVVLLDAPVAAALVLAGLPNVAALFLATSALYVASYEMLHLCYHLPDDGFIGRRRLVRALRRHHEIHHHPPLMQAWNFNVTVPLWDFVRGTVWRGPLPPAASQVAATPSTPSAPPTEGG
jgi:sterol desaturase/sphingolipid hydroxylase (fatty acid hydroxylase superfamily)